MKKILSFLLMFTLVIGLFAMPVQASTTDEIVFDGVTYQISQAVVDGKLQVTVVGDGEITVVTNNNNETLTVESLNPRTRTVAESYTIDITPEAMSVESRSFSSHQTPFWGYSYYVTMPFSTIGQYWFLEAGNNGRRSGYDYFDRNSREYAERFMLNVHNISNQQAMVIATGGAALAGVIAGALSAPTGLGAVIGIVLAAGGFASSAVFWLAAVSSRQEADYNFHRVTLRF